MSFDPASLFLSLIVSGIGFVGFMYGKKQVRFPHMMAGAILMVYPYFVPNAWAMAGVGAGIIALWITVVKLGM